MRRVVLICAAASVCVLACGQLAGLGDFIDAESASDGGAGGMGGSTGGESAGGDAGSGAMGGVANGGGGTGGVGGVGGIGGSGGQPCLGDADMDGVCDDQDICPGIQDNGDSTCTMFIDAEAAETLSRQMRRYDTDPATPDCPLTSANSTSGADSDNDVLVWHTQLKESTIGMVDRFNIQNVYLTFATGALDDGVTVESAQLFVDHASDTTSSNVLLYGGSSQPIFGGTVDGNDFFSATTLLDTMAIATIASQGFAELAVAASQVNLTGRTQLMISLDTACAWPNGGTTTNRWRLSSPLAAAGERPQLRVTYTP
jgi:hypothetical protein